MAPEPEPEPEPELEDQGGVAAPRRRAHRSRKVLTAVLIVLTCIGLLASILSVWTSRTLLDTDRFTAAVDRSLQEQSVIDATAAFVTSELSDALARSDVVEDLLPDNLARLAPVIERGLTGVIEQQATAIISSDAGRELIVGGVRLAHTAAVRLLEGEAPTEGPVVVEDGRVSLDLVPLITAVLERLGDLDAIDLRGRLAERDGPVADRIAALSDSLGIELPDDYGQLIVYDQELGSTASAIGSARTALELFRKAVVLIVVATLLLIGLTLLVAPDRRRALVWLGVGAAVSGLLAHLLIERVSEAVQEVFVDPAARQAAGDVIRQTVSRLDATVVVLSLIGAVLVVLVAFVTTERLTQGFGWLRRVVRTAPDAIRIVSVAVAVGILWWGGLRTWPVIGAGLVVAIGFGLTAGAARTPAPSAAPEPAPPGP